MSEASRVWGRLISAGVWFIALSSLAALNGLVLESTIKRLRSEGRDIIAVIKESAITRLRPVLYNVFGKRTALEE